MNSTCLTSVLLVYSAHFPILFQTYCVVCLVMLNRELDFFFFSFFFNLWYDDLCFAVIWPSRLTRRWISSNCLYIKSGTAPLRRSKGNRKRRKKEKKNILEHVGNAVRVLVSFAACLAKGGGLFVLPHGLNSLHKNNKVDQKVKKKSVDLVDKDSFLLLGNWKTRAFLLGEILRKRRSSCYEGGCILTSNFLFFFFFLSTWSSC